MSVIWATVERFDGGRLTLGTNWSALRRDDIFRASENGLAWCCGNVGNLEALPSTRRLIHELSGLVSGSQTTRKAPAGQTSQGPGLSLITAQVLLEGSHAPAPIPVAEQLRDRPSACVWYVPDGFNISIPGSRSRLPTTASRVLLATPPSRPVRSPFGQCHRGIR